MCRSGALAVVVVALTGCDAAAKLRGLFHGDDATGKAGLRVEVTPSEGISILLNGTRVATQSPYVAPDLAPGAHRLEVRGMGYHAVVLQVTLVNGKTVIVPVALRPRAGRDDAPAQALPAPGAPPLPSAAPPPPPLPAGIEPISLHLAPEPDVPILLDGARVHSARVTLVRVGGEIAVGVATLHYRFGSAGLLELSVAADGARWWRDGAVVKPGSAFKLHRGATRIRRTAEDGTDQSVLIRR